MYNMTILVCLYNKDIYTSNTIQSLLKSVSLIRNSKVFIWDNSLLSLDEKSINILKANFENFEYKHTPENIVLSKVYNSVIEEQTDSNSYLMLCDDDSTIPESFFIKLKDQIEFNKMINLFLPQIYSNSILVSPAKDYLIKTQLIKGLDPGVLKSKNVTAINSGMVISNRVFKEGFRYDEKLNFYGTDNFFMYQFSKKYQNLVVLDVVINHDLSFNDSKNLNNKIRIFKEIKRANKVIYSKDIIRKKLVEVNNFVVSLKLCIKHKTLAFFK